MENGYNFHAINASFLNFIIKIIKKNKYNLEDLLKFFLAEQIFKKILFIYEIKLEKENTK